MGSPESTALQGGAARMHVRFTCEDGDITEGVFLGLTGDTVLILDGGRVVRRATLDRDGNDRVFNMQPIGRSEVAPGASVAKGVAHVALAVGGFEPRERAA